MSDSNILINTLPEEIKFSALHLLKERNSVEVSFIDFKLVAGGCINHGGIFITSCGNYFVKWNNVHQNPKMFELEAKGLNLLRETNTLRVPEVIAFDHTENYQFIILQLLLQGKKSYDFWTDFGRKLAKLHQISSASFGLEYDNYIGSIRQQNKQTPSWIDFFVNQRIIPQLSMAERAGITDLRLRQKFDILFRKLPELLIERSPGLLHGDLWSGNLISDEYGSPTLIDPAVYYGNPEIELAYTKLFGGFDSSFLNAYQEITPIENGFNERADVYNLYPLLVHVNLFGKTYLAQVEEILNRFK